LKVHRYTYLLDGAGFNEPHIRTALSPLLHLQRIYLIEPFQYITNIACRKYMVWLRTTLITLTNLLSLDNLLA